MFNYNQMILQNIEYLPAPSISPVRFIKAMFWEHSVMIIPSLWPIETHVIKLAM